MGASPHCTPTLSALHANLWKTDIKNSGCVSVLWTWSLSDDMQGTFPSLRDRYDAAAAVLILLFTFFVLYKMAVTISPCLWASLSVTRT